MKKEKEMKLIKQEVDVKARKEFWEEKVREKKKDHVEKKEDPLKAKLRPFPQPMIELEDLSQFLLIMKRSGFDTCEQFPFISPPNEEVSRLASGLSSLWVSVTA